MTRPPLPATLSRSLARSIPAARARHAGALRFDVLVVFASFHVYSLAVLASITWPTAASLATAAGTLVLAAATFASVRSANRSARVAELALQEQRRPLLVHSRLDDPAQKIMFVEQRWLQAAGGHAVAEHVDGVVYFVMSLRNVGAGIGVLQGWRARPGLLRATIERSSEEQFRAQSRDLYIPAGDVGLWQGALRDLSEAEHAEIAEAVDRREAITIELLYSDQIGGQRTITRFALTPAAEREWLIGAGRHWYLDREGPR